MRFVHFAWSWLKFQWWKLNGWKRLVSSKTADQRFSECKFCPHYEDGECLKCGCLAQAKVLLASESCPRGYWFSVKILADKQPD